MWDVLSGRGVTIFIHPDADAPAVFRRPSALIEVAFEAARTLVDMLYAGTMRDRPRLGVVVAHAGGAFPALFGRVRTLGNEAWIRNPRHVTVAEMEQYTASLYLDTPAAGSPHMMLPAVELVGEEHLIYGSDCGVPCTTDDVMLRNIEWLRDFNWLDTGQLTALGRRAVELLPRIGASSERVRVPYLGCEGTGAMSLGTQRD
jgi:6-methylsalicylate decarboxylase